MRVRSWRHKLVVTTIGILATLMLFEARTIDSRYAARQASYRETVALPSPGARLRFSATAYCKGSITASGVVPRTGVAAADPLLLPVGSVIQVGADSANSGIYTIMDTGPAVLGRHIDIYMWSCQDALRFGRRAVDVMVLRMGWDPQATPPNLVDTLLNRPRPPQRERLPSKPLPLDTPNDQR